MTTVYFVRHAEPNYNNHDDSLRELSAKGLKDRKLVTAFLADKGIDVALSSPYKRAIDTIRDFTDSFGLHIDIMDEFRERKVDSEWIEDFVSHFHGDSGMILHINYQTENVSRKFRIETFLL